MQEDTDYDSQTQTPSASEQAHWTSLQLAEFLKDKGANVDAVAEPNREVSLEEESKSVLQTSAQSNTEVDGSADYTSPSSEGTSFKEPEQRSKKPIRFNEVVKRRTKRKTSISEAVPLEQVKFVFQTSMSVQIREEVDNNIEQKFLSRFSDKPDVPWFMTEDSVIMKMTEGKKKRDKKDAQVHSRLPSVKRKEHIKEQADWRRTRQKELLRNDIKEILREELAVEHAKMRKLFRKEVEEIMGLLRNELSQICMALLKEQAKEIQQEHWNLQYLRLKDLFRRDIKEIVCKQINNSKIIICPKEPLPGPSKGTTDFQTTAPEKEKKKKYKGAHDSAPSHSGKPLVETDEKSVDGQNESHCMPLKDLIKEDLKESLCEILEKYKYDTCMKKELPHILEGRKQLRKISSEQKLKKKYDSKFLYSEQTATKTVKKVEHERGALQYVHLTEVIKRDLKVGICEVFGKYETNVCPKEEALPHFSKKKTRSKVEEKKSEHLYIPHFSSFEHRIAALRATAHIESASAACAGYSGDAAVDQQYLEAIKLISMVKLK